MNPLVHYRRQLLGLQMLSYPIVKMASPLNRSANRNGIVTTQPTRSHSIVSASALQTYSFRVQVEAETCTLHNLFQAEPELPVSNGQEIQDDTVPCCCIKICVSP